MDDELMDALRRTVAEPVVRSLLTDDELEQVTVQRRRGDEGDEVWVVVVAVGEVFHGWLNPPAPPGPDDAGWTLEDSARHLADDLEDWIAESGFGWGQQRTACYVLPPA